MKMGPKFAMRSHVKSRSLVTGALALSALASAASANIVTKPVTYQSGTLQCEGYMAYDDKFTGKRPAVLIAHQWLGLTTYEKTRAVQLASMGYVAFAVDLYGKGNRPNGTEEAGKMAAMLKGNRPLWRQRMNDSLKALQVQPNVDTNKIDAIGYCLGGGSVLELARSGANVKGVVTFHGSLDTPTPEDAKNIKGKVLVLHGASDPFSPLPTVVALSDEMAKAKVDYRIVLYGGAVHSFTEKDAGNDPSKGAAYDADADQRSFEAMAEFLDQTIGDMAVTPNV